ncbi:Rhodanese-like domain-containing protein [Tricharina praecox]|uniref:Rhodanese-like domain-containing protein n=1 Tax=Tricharina praecox TaxID=43433 RepID=UPI002220271B|nr:Rhodanese-like domain-containing protein [Tricharina praecox]KAI5849244.1 Rhodanese-like domain-containing protein [Tricharina praecox]
MATTEQKPAPWHAAFPAPVSKATFVTREETRKLFEAKTAGKDFILVDVRRTDFEGGTIKHSINLPAHSLYPTREAIYNLLHGAGVSLAIFYCGSSNGRGPRASAWLQDYINEKGDETIKSVALEGGIKGWVGAGEEYVQLVEGYEAEVWAKGGEGC